MEKINKYQQYEDYYKVAQEEDNLTKAQLRSLMAELAAGREARRGDRVYTSMELMSRINRCNETDNKVHSLHYGELLPEKGYLYRVDPVMDEEYPTGKVAVYAIDADAPVKVEIPLQQKSQFVSPQGMEFKDGKKLDHSPSIKEDAQFFVSLFKYETQKDGSSIYEWKQVQGRSSYILKNMHPGVVNWKALEDITPPGPMSGIGLMTWIIAEPSEWGKVRIILRDYLRPWAECGKVTEMKIGSDVHPRFEWINRPDAENTKVKPGEYVRATTIKQQSDHLGLDIMKTVYSGYWDGLDLGVHHSNMRAKARIIEGLDLSSFKGKKIYVATGQAIEFALISAVLKDKGIEAVQITKDGSTYYTEKYVIHCDPISAPSTDKAVDKLVVSVAMLRDRALLKQVMSGNVKRGIGFYTTALTCHYQPEDIPTASKAPGNTARFMSYEFKKTRYAFKMLHSEMPLHYHPYILGTVADMELIPDRQDPMGNMWLHLDLLAQFRYTMVTYIGDTGKKVSVLQWPRGKLMLDLSFETEVKERNRRPKKAIAAAVAQPGKNRRPVDKIQPGPNPVKAFVEKRELMDYLVLPSVEAGKSDPDEQLLEINLDFLAPEKPEDSEEEGIGPEEEYVETQTY